MCVYLPGPSPLHSCQFIPFLLKKNIYFLDFICIRYFAYTYICALHVWLVPGKSEVWMGFSATGITDVCKHHVDDRRQTLNHWVISPATIQTPSLKGNTVASQRLNTGDYIFRVYKVLERYMNRPGRVWFLSQIQDQTA